MLERCHFPSFGGRVKPVLVVRIRKHKGCPEECQGRGEQPKQNQAPNRQRLTKKCHSLLLLLLQPKKKLVYALESQAVLRARLGSQCLCRLGEPVRQHRFQLCVCDHLSENFTIHALLDWAQCTPLMLNDYRQTTFCSGLCILDWSMQYPPLSCSYSGCLLWCPWGITAYRPSIPHQERPHSEGQTPKLNTVCFFPFDFRPWGHVLGGGGVHAPQPVLLCSAIVPGCCRKIISIVPHAGKLPRQTKLSQPTSL